MFYLKIYIFFALLCAKKLRNYQWKTTRVHCRFLSLNFRFLTHFWANFKNEGDQIEPTKEETAVAKHLRWNCPKKTSTMMGNKVEYFIGKFCVVKNQFFEHIFIVYISFFAESVLKYFKLDEVLTLP